MVIHEKTERKAPYEVLKECLKERNLTQGVFVMQCRERGYRVTQGSLSKVLSGKKKMSIEECMAFCDVLDISANKFLFSEKENTFDDDAFFLLPEDDIADAVKMTGIYDLLFESTAKEENGKAITGVLQLYRERSRIRAEILIDTCSAPKQYSGYLWKNRQWPVAYVIVKRYETGEIASFAMRNRSFSVAEMRGRIALCLSTSAGEQKDPILRHVALIRKNEDSDNENNNRNTEEIVKWLREKESFRLDAEEDIAFFQQLNKWGGTL